MNQLNTMFRFISHGWAMTCLLPIIWISPSSDAVAQSRLQAGVLVCSGDGDWSATIKSKKQFECTFSSTYGEVRGKYAAEIRDFSASVSPSGSTVLIWHVSGPPEKIGENYKPGELEGVYVSAGIESPRDTEFNADTLVGRGPRSFALRPISVQFETGSSIATGVKILAITYIGPLSI